MKMVEFMRRYGRLTCWHGQNHTGVYVLASEAEESERERKVVAAELFVTAKKLSEAAERERVLMEILKEMVQAFVDYEMEVDIEPHHEHIKMMRKARAALAQKGG